LRHQVNGRRRCHLLDAPRRRRWLGADCTTSSEKSHEGRRSLIKLTAKRWPRAAATATASTVEHPFLSLSSRRERPLAHGVAAPAAVVHCRDLSCFSGEAKEDLAVAMTGTAADQRTDQRQIERQAESPREIEGCAGGRWVAPLLSSATPGCRSATGCLNELRTVSEF